MGSTETKEGREARERRERWLESINNYNCTLSVMADKLGIRLWVAMEIGKWAEIRREKEIEDGKKGSAQENQDKEKMDKGKKKS